MASVNTSIRVGLTSSADYLMASQGVTLKQASRAPQGLADAKLATKGNHQDDLVLQLRGRQDVLTLSAAKLEVPTGKMPVAGDTIQLLKGGKAFDATVKYVDIESVLSVASAPNATQPTPAEAALIAAAEKQAEAARVQADAAQAELQARRQREKAQAAAAGIGMLIFGGAAVGHHVKKSLR